MIRQRKKKMYALTLQRNFRARHYLIGGDWGPENDPHSHDYRVEIRLRARDLDANGYLIDLDDLERFVDTCVAYYRGMLLNDSPDFDGVNPSIERFAKRFHTRFLKQIGPHRFQAVEIRIWETDEAWASYQEKFP
jgi:6-pyruvoyltetrahydropterin/6-carboxytetrahydropterin synthase